MILISDIDDTIKVSHTQSILYYLLYTLILPPHPVEGMPRLYSKLSDRIDQYIYVSASPSILRPLYSRFIQRYFPSGNLILKSLASYLSLPDSRLQDNILSYKLNALSEICLKSLNEKYICVGDSAQADPEVYGKLYNRFPELIKYIWIRQIELKNEDERWRKAFQGVPDEVCTVFHDPAELMAYL